ncbi:MAG: subclass B1 metallo-beta-lactamase [Maricaulaceae bacterium]
MRHFLFSFAAIAALTACGNETSPSAAPTQNEPDITAQYPVQLQSIGEGIWVHTSAYTYPGGAVVPSNGLVIEEEDGLILVDTAWGEMATASLLKSLKDKTSKDVKKLIVTHHHYDRLAGVDILEREGVDVVSHPSTAALSAAKGTPVPNSSVSELGTVPARVKIGSVEVAYPGPGHTEDNLVVYVPSANILFAGCLVRGADQTSLGNIDDANIEGWQKSLAWTKVTYKDAKLVIPGHGKGSTLNLIDKTIKLAAEAQAKETAAAPKE